MCTKNIQIVLFLKSRRCFIKKMRKTARGFAHSPKTCANYGGKLLQLSFIPFDYRFVVLHFSPNRVSLNTCFRDQIKAAWLAILNQLRGYDDYYWRLLNRIMTEEYLKQLNLDELIQLMMKNIQELQAMHKANKQQQGMDEKRKQVELLHKIIAEKKGEMKPDLSK